MHSRDSLETMPLKRLAARQRATEPCSALPIAGDDPAAKAAVTEFLDAIVYDTVDAGTAAAGGGVDAQVLDEHPQRPGALNQEHRGVGPHEDLCPNERGRVRVRRAGDSARRRQSHGRSG